jgi:hypothetical protein
MAVRSRHESEAKKALIRARRNKFPENFEREAGVHQGSAEPKTTFDRTPVAMTLLIAAGELP